MKKIVLSLVFGVLFIHASTAGAEVTPTTGMTSSPTAATELIAVDRTADHEALRVMLKDAERSINARDFDALERHLDPNVVVIYQNAEVADGVQAVKAFQKRMLGNGGVLKDIKTTVTADALTKFYGDTAVAYGTANDVYTFANGSTMNLTSKWQTTLIKEDGEWKVVSLQYTSNLFDNPLLRQSGMIAVYVGIGASLITLLLCAIVAKVIMRKQKAQVVNAEKVEQANN